MTVQDGMSIISVHTPTTSFAVMHSFTQDTLQALFSKLSKKTELIADERGRHDHVGPGWVKYEFNDNVWNLDDESDYTILAWRQKSRENLTANSDIPQELPAVLHLHNPAAALPQPPAFHNPSFYAYNRPKTLSPSRAGSIRGANSIKSGKSKKSTKSAREVDASDGVPKFKKEFYDFHNENGVRTVIGSIGPIRDVRMLLKNGYRHVYISRAFAQKHAFIPKNAQPGMYGYGGLVNIGQWPITVGKTKTLHSVYLSEETHFDCILGRSFMEARNVKTDVADPTSVMCLDTGEKVDCELVVIRDGNGEIVTVT